MGVPPSRTRRQTTPPCPALVTAVAGHGDNIVLVIPSIDIRAGKVVRLRYGDPDQQTVYEGAPAEIARSFEAAGAELIHVVDLDGAFSGAPAARDIIREIVSAVSVPVEVGGGIRTMQIIEGHMALGVRRVVLGTAAIADDAFLRAAVSAVGGAVVGGIDARDGQVALRGWVETSSESAVRVGERMFSAGVREVVHTDIGRDGVMTGPNIDASRRLAEETGLSVIVSGGVSCIEDVRRANEAARDAHADGRPLISGCITGRAIYEGALDLAEAVRVTRQC